MAENPRSPDTSSPTERSQDNQPGKDRSVVDEAAQKNKVRDDADVSRGTGETSGRKDVPSREDVANGEDKGVGERLDDSANDLLKRMENEMAKVRAELAELKSDAEAKATQLAREARAAGHVAAGYVGRAVDYGEATVRAAQDQVRARPLASVGVAFALGALTATLVHRYR